MKPKQTKDKIIQTPKPIPKPIEPIYNITQMEIYLLGIS